MEYQDIVFTPYSDTGANDISIINEHKNLISQNKFNDAVTAAKQLGNGFTASFFNGLRARLRAIEVFILNEFIAENGEYYSYNEPNEEEMPEDAKIFIHLLD